MGDLAVSEFSDFAEEQKVCSRFSLQRRWRPKLLFLIRVLVLNV